MYDVLVIGCGIVGAATAFELSRYDLSVAVVERSNDVAAGTTKANSAILHAGYDPEPGTLMAKLNVEGVSMAAELCPRLDVPYQRCGSMVLAFCDGDLKTIRKLYDKGAANGVPELRLLSGDEARALEPELSPEVCGALLAPSAAITSPWEYALALAETAVRNGAELFLEQTVTEILPTKTGYQVMTSQGTFEARMVVNAAGVHSDTVHNMAFPPAFQIIPDRGEYYLLDKTEGKRVKHVIFQCPTKAGKGTLVSPTVHGNLIVGPNNEPPVDGDDVATTSNGLAEVGTMAKKSVPGVNLRESIRNFAGVRAAADVDDFIIRRAGPGFVDLAGIKSPGLSAAPAIGKMAVELLQKEGLALRKKDNFLCDRKRVRFKELSTEEKADVIRKNPAYGRVICRCETVTEGEILDALHSPIPPRSVDGVKRRCNAGMGRCQGGFCGPRVVEILSRELGLPMTRIPQDGAETFLLTSETKEGAAHV